MSIKLNINMTKRQLKEQVQNFITKLKPKKALDLIKCFIDHSDRDYTQLENAILMQMANLARAKQDSFKGISTVDRNDRIIAKVNYAALEIADQIEEDDDSDCPGLESKRKQPRESTTITTKIKVLFLTANPEGSTQLRLDKEIRYVKNGFQSATQRDKFEFISEPAVRIADITRAITSQKPQIVHFSGHGSGKDGLLVEGNDGKIEYFTTEALSRLFNLFKDKVECVILNACHSNEQASAIGKTGEGSNNNLKGLYTVGTNSAIGDLAAIDFSVGFYQAIGEGHDYEFAYQMGLVHVNDSEAAEKSEIWFNGRSIRDKQ